MIGNLALTPSSPTSGRGLLARGGPQGPPYKVNEGVVLDPNMLFREMKLTCKKLDKNLKNWVRFWDLKIWQHWDFASAPVTKIHVTRSIFEIEGSSFGFSLIFVCSKNHILQLKVSDRFFNDLIFYTPLPKGGRIKNLNSNLVKILF